MSNSAPIRWSDCETPVQRTGSAIRSVAARARWTGFVLLNEQADYVTLGVDSVEHWKENFEHLSQLSRADSLAPAGKCDTLMADLQRGEARITRLHLPIQR